MTIPNAYQNCEEADSMFYLKWNDSQNGYSLIIYIISNGHF
jgi:hypothetical protein